MMFLEFPVRITLLRDMLATNPIDPSVHDTHILNRQREIIMEKSKINKEVNKYLDALQISAEKGKAEVDNLLDRLQTLMGIEFTDEERKLAAAGDLAFLKQTLAEVETQGTTVFFWNKELQRPMIGDHMILGFLKAAGEAICRTKERKNGVFLHSGSFTSSCISQYVRVKEQFITFDRDVRRDANGHPRYCQRSLRAMTAKGPRISLAKSEVVEAGANLAFTLRVMDKCPVTKAHLIEMFEYGELSGIGQWRGAGNGCFSFEMMG